MKPNPNYILFQVFNISSPAKHPKPLPSSSSPISIVRPIGPINLDFFSNLSGILSEINSHKVSAMALTSLKSSSGRKDKSKSSKRKLEKRLQFHAKVQDASSGLGAKKTINKKKRLKRRQKKLKAYDLSALSEFLPDLGSCQNPADTTHKKLNCKSRQKLLQRESVQMRAVLNNLVFQMDPIAAIQCHLESTQPPSAMAHQEGSCHKQEKVKKKKAKAKKKGSQSSMMDI